MNSDYVGLYYHLGALHVAMEEPQKGMMVYEEGIEVAKKLNDHHALSELMNAKINLEMEI